MTERLIGYGYTNSSGVAILKYDANGTQLDPTGYTGVGAGVVDIKAKLHDDSSLQSETYSVLDAIIRDGGTLSDKNDNCWKEIQTSNKGDLNRFDSYSQIIEKTSSSNTIFSIQENNTYKQLPPSVMIEMDIKQVDGASTDTIFNSRPNGISNVDYLRSLSGFGFSDNDWHSIQLKLTPTRISSMVNGVEITGKSVTDEVNYWTFGIWTTNTTSEVHFKNLRIYPI